MDFQARAADSEIIQITAARKMTVRQEDLQEKRQGRPALFAEMEPAMGFEPATC